MSMKKKFIISNVIMLVAPLVLIALITLVIIISFVLSYHISDTNINLWDLLNPNKLISLIGGTLEKEPSTAKYVYLWIFLSAIITIATNMVNSVILLSSIRTPVLDLTKAVERMKKGDMDVYIMRTDAEEIDTLCVAFDEMRMQLKQTRALEQKHIEQRRMLLANLSHDLRTPITSIKGYVQGIQDGIADTPEKLDRYLSTIYAKAVVIEEMVNNLSMLTNLETGDLKFEFELGDVNELLRQLADEYRLDIGNNNIRFNLNLADKPAVIKVDNQKMRRVFTNLIENAIKYRKDENSCISISSVFENKGILICVEDNGIGIKAGDMDRIFDGFFRSDPARNLNIKGSGLGLGIAKQIVEKHGGKIWAKSEIDKGTAMFVFLPVRDTEDNKGDNYGENFNN